MNKNKILNPLRVLLLPIMVMALSPSISSAEPLGIGGDDLMSSSARLGLNKPLNVNAVSAQPVSTATQNPRPLHSVEFTSGHRIISSHPIPESLRQKLYQKPAQVRPITPAQIRPQPFRPSGQTAVGQKVGMLQNDLGRLQAAATSLASELNSIQVGNEQWASEYYANVATINTQLQSGTTRGNPRLVNRLNDAEVKLESLADNLARLNTLSVQASNLSSEMVYLLEETRATYSVAGAIEEDHVRLNALEDSAHAMHVASERILNSVNDDVSRVSTYLASERNNLRTLALGVANGDLYGRSLANRPFSGATAYNNAVASAQPNQPMAAAAPVSMMSSGLSGPRPLAKIRFDKADVDYQQPVYAAVNEALQRFPNARFDLVAVHPASGNAAQKAIESTKARRNAEKVLRTLVQMGLPMEQIDLSYSESAQASSNEVHLFVK